MIDSIARRYQDSAAANGQAVNASAPEGTYAHALYKFDSVIEDCLRITFDYAPEEHKDKANKLVDIWRKAGTFTESKLTSAVNNYSGSTTPPSAPPSTNSTQASSQYAAPAQVNANDLLKNLAALGAASAGPAPVSAPAGQPTSGFPPVAPPPAANSAPAIPGLADPQQAIAQLLSQMQSTGQLPPFPTQGAPSQSPPHQHEQHQQQVGGRSRFGDTALSQEEAFRRAGGEGGRERERGGNAYSRRQRSRSPRRQRDLPPPGHVIGEKNLPGTAHYRERNVQLDPNLPYNSIKVLSRTMFVGGIPGYMSQDDVKAVLRPYAEVQSVILNPERKHAFVKAYSRREAEAVLQNYSKITSVNLRVRWGVGFGPRDCCDYQHGMSIIPIDRLTEADKRWVHSAEWGGIGFERELVPNLVMEEPDIEIGEGVSSKAISKKMPTDGSRNGPRSSKPGEAPPPEVAPSEMPAFMRNNMGATQLANLFNNGGGVPPAPPAAAAAPSGGAAPATDSAAQLASLMAMLQNQQK